MDAGVLAPDTLFMLLWMPPMIIPLLLLSGLLFQMALPVCSFQLASIALLTDRFWAVHTASLAGFLHSCG
eukprot:7625686-Prorocentrum_lima.AAC.1